jgi:hypothetical protein
MKTKTSFKKLSTPFLIRQRAGRSFPLAPTLVATALIACGSLQTRADTIALSFTGGLELASGLNGPTVGWAFTLSSQVSVTQLGLFDFDGNGFGTDHIVAIWTSTGTQLGQVTIASGTSGTLINGFRYVSIAPLLLPAGDYTIGGYYPFPGTDTFAAFANSITTTSGVTYLGSRADFFPFGVFGFPAGDIFDSDNSYFGPNFQFTGGVPTPDSGSTWALLLVSVTAAFGLNLLLHRRSEV